MRQSVKRALGTLVLALVASTARAQLRVVTITSERTNGVTPQGLTEGSVPGISEDGTIAFWGTTASNRNTIIVGDGTAVWPIDVGSAGLSRPRSIRLNGDALVFVADAPSARGVYVVDRTGGQVTPLYVLSGQGKLPSMSDVALSSLGVVAFATVCSDCGRVGGLFMGSRFGPMTEIQRGTPGGPFLYNSQYLDLNDKGQIALQGEYLPGYRRAIFVISQPGQPLEATDTVVEGLPTGSQPRPVINNRGEVAYVLDGAQLWLGTPTRFGTPKAARVVVDTQGPFASFERVEIDEQGGVVFEATLDDGRRGIFVGPDPVAHKVVVDGDTIGGLPVSRVVAMGQLNQQRQLVLCARLQPNDDLRVLRLTALPVGPH
jgi:hypothetical protein